MGNGNFVLHRALVSSPVWMHADLWRLWCWCLFTIADRPRDMCIGGVPLRVAAGQLAAPPADICRATGLSLDALRCCLEIGKRSGFLDVRATPWWLRIEIVNWQDYRTPTRRIARPTPQETRQNDKEKRTWT
jgi:hypothetical protein